MTEWMNQKGILSRGDFGVEKTEKRSENFGLLKKPIVAGRVIDLSRRHPGVFLAIAEKIIKQKRGRKKKFAEGIKNAGPQAVQAMELFRQFPQNKTRNAEPIDISHPQREDILAILEQIESINHSLKNQTWRVEANFADEPVLIIEQAEQELPEVEDLSGIDIEDYLWLKDPVSEPDSLASLLTEPDLGMANEPVIEIAGNPAPSFLNLAEERENVINGLEEPILSGQEEGQPDFLARWRQKNNKNEVIATIPHSRKSWGDRNSSRTNGFKFINLIRRNPVKIRAKSGFSRQAAGFFSAGFLIYLVVFGLSLAGQGLLAKENILSSALQAYKSMLAAKNSASSLNFSAAEVNFDTAYQNFLAANQELNKIGRGIIYVLEKLPGGSPVGSGAALVAAGENFAQAGQSFAKIASIFLAQNLGEYFSDNGPSLTQKIIEAQGEIAKAQDALIAAGKNLDDVNVGDLPGDLAPQVAELKAKMPPVIEAAGQLKIWSNVFLGVFGHNQAKKYLLVFQNNSEARATGGFIGTYGVADLDEGRLKNLFIDGIFNLDGQLYDKIVPPKPIQKISTAWSTHDANWFADWPTSARKIMGFYEKAGGQTVDGVISMTPMVVERLLALIGPIDMPQYGLRLDQNNFLDVTQYKVEIDYDKAQNQPKKILADFAPLFLDKLWQIWPARGQEIMKVLVDSLAEKHILFYFTDPYIEQSFASQGWTGEIISTEKDYLSVVNTNINGFKTDKVIDQKIYHTASVQSDGSVVDTVKIVRAHNGGTSQYDWYNKVNADYLRVYVPLGSKLMAAEGQTLEAYSAPIDYQAQGFKADADVQAQESGRQIDPVSGTQIFMESGKTVFGNWAFLSPGETVEITYQYLLPFKIDLNQESSSYSLLAQKQAGSMGSFFESILQLPEQAKITWQYPSDLEISGKVIKFSDNLRTDKFYGIVLGR